MNSRRRGFLRSIRSDDVRSAVRSLLRTGWEGERDGRGHLVLVSPAGDRVRLSSTAFSGPATKSKVEELRRICGGARRRRHAAAAGEAGPA